MVLAGDPTCLWCSSRSGASLRNVPILAFGWTGDLHHFPPVGFWSNALEILFGAFCLRVSPPQGCERSHASPVYAHSGPSHAYQATYSSSSCGGVDMGHHLLLGSISQCSPLACGWPLTPTGELPWSPGGLCHVGGLSLRTGGSISFGGWATEWLWQPPFCPPPIWQYPLIFVNDYSGKTGCLWWPLPSGSGLQGGKPGSLLSKYTLW